MAIVQTRICTFIDVHAIDPIARVARVTVARVPAGRVRTTGVRAAVVQTTVRTFINILAAVGSPLITRRANAGGIHADRKVICSTQRVIGNARIHTPGLAVAAVTGAGIAIVAHDRGRTGATSIEAFITLRAGISIVAEK